MTSVPHAQKEEKKENLIYTHHTHQIPTTASFSPSQYDMEGVQGFGRAAQHTSENEFI
jgi:hypothetical protein